MRNLILLLITVSFAMALQIGLYHIETPCYEYHNKRNCTDYPSKCIWCSNSKYPECIEKADNCECVAITSFLECVKNPNCQYCNLGAYAGRYCLGKNAICG